MADSFALPVSDAQLRRPCSQEYDNEYGFVLYEPWCPWQCGWCSRRCPCSCCCCCFLVRCGRSIPLPTLQDDRLHSSLSVRNPVEFFESLVNSPPVCIFQIHNERCVCARFVLSGTDSCPALRARFALPCKAPRSSTWRR